MPARAAALVAALAVAMIGVAVVVVDRTGDGDPTAGADTFTFPPIVLDAGAVVVRRTWTTDEGSGDLLATVEFETTGVGGNHFEVIPKAVAATVDDLVFDPPPTEIIEVDPVVRYDIDELLASGRTSFTYRATVPGLAEGEVSLAELSAGVRDVGGLFRPRQDIDRGKTLRSAPSTTEP